MKRSSSMVVLLAVAVLLSTTCVKILIAAERRPAVELTHSASAIRPSFAPTERRPVSPAGEPSPPEETRSDEKVAPDSRPDRKRQHDSGETEPLDFNPLERAISGMRDAQQRILGRKTGDETREIQQQVIDDLAKLIQQAEKTPPRRSQPSPPPRSEQQQDQQNQREQQQQEQSGRQRDKQDNQAQSQQRRNHKQDRKAEFLHRKLAADIWGHLPEKLRDKLRNVSSGKPLPKYNKLVRRYFEALAEEDRNDRPD